MGRSSGSRVTICVALLADAAALLGFYFVAMPSMRRPFEMLMLLCAVLGVMTAAAVKNSATRGIAAVIASVAFALFLLEMAEKLFGVTEFFGPKPLEIVAGDAGEGYAWRIGDPAGYLAALDKARRDGLEPEALEDGFAGDVFAGTDRPGLVKNKRIVGGAEAATEGWKPFYLTGTDLGYEHNPDNLVRDYGRDEASGRVVFDAAYRITGFGGRETRGNAASDEAYLFLGDSFTFGAFLDGDGTAAHYFSALHGFEKNVVNFGTMGWGPHHVLRDLELNRRIGPALIEGGTVRGVFYSLIDTHADRASTPTPKYMTAPYYVLDDAGKPVLRIRGASGGFGENMAAMMEKSRIYPVLRDRLSRRIHAGDRGYKWRLTVALLVEIDRLCRERYGAPLTVVYWDEDPAAAGMLRDAGLDIVSVSEALPDGPDWRRRGIKYMTFDGHPSAYANKKLAEYLFTLNSREGR